MASQALAGAYRFHLTKLDSSSIPALLADRVCITEKPLLISVDPATNHLMESLNHGKVLSEGKYRKGWVTTSRAKRKMAKPIPSCTIKEVDIGSAASKLATWVELPEEWDTSFMGNLPYIKKQVR